MAAAVILCVGLVLLAGLDGGGGLYVPERGTGSSVKYNVTDGWFKFPEDDSSVTNYFISPLDFSIVPGSLVTGAANRLYVLDEDSLCLQLMYEWNSSTDNLQNCRNGELLDGNVDYTCTNHIRVYHRYPSNPDFTLVCGTNAGYPKCRLIELPSPGECGGIRYAIEQFSAVPAADGLVSFLPEFSQFGTFREDFDSDPVYFSAGFYDGSNDLGRHFSISYHNITLATTSDPSSALETEELFATIEPNTADNYWLQFPVTFVGFEKADYPSFDNNPRDYQFWFVLLREDSVQPDEDIIYSRLVRICRNDRGSNGADPIFTSYMKARIYCERAKPSGREFTGSLSFQYNSITSFEFANTNDPSSPGRLLYGAFTGPTNGPLGSALCVYSADNTAEGGTGRSESVFDVFREDITTGAPGSTAVEHNFVECSNVREGSDQQLVFINTEVHVQQKGIDPLLVLDDEIITQMVHDTVCVVTSSDSAQCDNQHVLFLGLASGRVLKVVFGSLNGRTFPIIAEDIQLDDNEQINSLQLRQLDGNQKYLYVATANRIYKLPTQRCSRFENFRECVSSRDPYCVYNTSSHTCTPHTLTSGTPVPTHLVQNIHTGFVLSVPIVTFDETYYSIGEGAGSVTLSLTATHTGTSVTVTTLDGTATEDDYSSTHQVITFENQLTLTVSISITNDVALETAQYFYVHIEGGVGVVTENSMATVTILDDDNDGVEGVQVQLQFAPVITSITFSTTFLDFLTKAVTDAIVDNCFPSNCNDVTTEHLFNPAMLVEDCPPSLKLGNPCTTLIFTTSLLSSELASSQQLLTSLDNWVSKQNQINIGNLKLEANCLFNVDNSTYLTCPDVTGTTGGLRSTDDGNNRTAFTVVLVFLILFVMVVVGLLAVVVLLLVFYRRDRKDSLSFCTKGKNKISCLKNMRPGSTHQPADHTPKSPPKAIRLNSYQGDVRIDTGGKGKVQADGCQPLSDAAPFNGFAGPTDYSKYQPPKCETAETKHAYDTVSTPSVAAQVINRSEELRRSMEIRRSQEIRRSLGSPAMEKARRSDIRSFGSQEFRNSPRGLKSPLSEEVRRSMGSQELLNSSGLGRVQRSDEVRRSTGSIGGTGNNGSWTPHAT